MAVIQNTLYLTTDGTVVHRDHLTLRVEIEKQTRLTVPIHHLESICAFGRIVVTPPAMALCWRHQVAVHYHTESGHLLAQVLGSGDTRYLLRRLSTRRRTALLRHPALRDSLLRGNCRTRVPISSVPAGKLMRIRTVMSWREQLMNWLDSSGNSAIPRPNPRVAGFGKRLIRSGEWRALAQRYTSRRSSTCSNNSEKSSGL